MKINTKKLNEFLFSTEVAAEMKSLVLDSVRYILENATTDTVNMDFLSDLKLLKSEKTAKE